MMNISTNKIVCVVFIFCFFLLPASAIAELYEWRDEKGDIHVVDDMLLIPPQYRDKAKVIKAKPPYKATPPHPSPLPTPSEQEEFYGNYLLTWWKAEFNARKNEISELEKAIEEQKSFMADYERGRRLYKLYSKEDVEKYETYKKELPDNENQLNKLKSDLEEFRRKAQIYGVPRAIRE